MTGQVLQGSCHAMAEEALWTPMQIVRVVEASKQAGSWGSQRHLQHCSDFSDMWYRWESWEMVKKHLHLALVRAGYLWGLGLHSSTTINRKSNQSSKLPHSDIMTTNNAHAAFHLKHWSVSVSVSVWYQGLSHLGPHTLLQLSTLPLCYSSVLLLFRTTLKPATLLASFWRS